VPALARIVPACQRARVPDLCRGRWGGKRREAPPSSFAEINPSFDQFHCPGPGWPTQGSCGKGGRTGDPPPPWPGRASKHARLAWTMRLTARLSAACFFRVPRGWQRTPRAVHRCARAVRSARSTRLLLPFGPPLRRGPPRSTLLHWHCMSYPLLPVLSSCTGLGERGVDWPAFDRRSTQTGLSRPLLLFSSFLFIVSSSRGSRLSASSSPFLPPSLSLTHNLAYGPVILSIAVWLRSSRSHRRVVHSLPLRIT
jgi:hypothetical protein